MSERFEIKPAYRALLAANGLTDLSAWLNFAGGKVVSCHLDRRTISLGLSGPNSAGSAPGAEPLVRLFAKIHTSTPPKQMLRDFLGGNRPTAGPVKEWRWLHRLAGLGVDTMEPVAVGQRRRGGLPTAAVLVVRAVPAPADLHRLLQDTPGLYDDVGLWSAIGRLVAVLGRNAIAWPDLSSKHLFPQQTGERSEGRDWRLFLIDVERMRRDWPARRVRATALDGLLRSLPGMPGGQAIRALAEACRIDPDGLLNRAKRILRPKPPQPDDHWLRVQPELIRRGPLIVNARYSAMLAEAGLTDLESIFAFSSGQSLTKPDLPPYRRRDRIILPLPPGRQDDGGAASTAIYLKRYEPSWWRRLGRTVRPGVRASEAADEWHALWRLASADVPAPEPVFFGQVRSWPAARRGCIGLAELAGAEALARWLPVHGPTLAVERRRHLARSLGRFVGYFHSLGLVHRDLYFSHVFISLNADGSPIFHLIDLARVFRPNRLRRRRWRVKDLAQLLYASRDDGAASITRTDRLRFLMSYLGLNRLTGSGRRLVRAVGRKADRIARHAGKQPSR